MSHILDRGGDFDKLLSIVETASENSITPTMIDEDLNYLIPKSEQDKSMIDTVIKENGLAPAAYYPDGNFIKMSSKRMESWVETNCESLKDNFFIKDTEIFRGYLYLYCLGHEVEHSYQRLIANGQVDVINPYVQGLYYNILKMFKRDNYIIPRPIKETRKRIALFRYRLNENIYVLERNASLEGYDLVYRLANHYKNQEMLNAFYCCRTLYCKAGYKDNNLGSFAETYRAMLMSKEFEKIVENNLFQGDDAIRYGLPVEEEVRQKVLSL